MSFLFRVSSEKFLASQTLVERKHVWGTSGMAGSVENWGGWRGEAGLLARGARGLCPQLFSQEGRYYHHPHGTDEAIVAQEAPHRDLLWMLTIGFAAF